MNRDLYFSLADKDLYKINVNNAGKKNDVHFLIAKLIKNVSYRFY